MAAEGTDPAGISQPGNPDPVADPVRRDATAYEIDAADDFMPWDNWVADVRQFPVDDMKVGPADATGTDPDANLPVGRDRIGLLPRLKAAPPSR
jgi:hypothetical protein